MEAPVVQRGGFFSPCLQYTEETFDTSFYDPELIFNVPNTYEPTDVVFIVQNERFPAHKRIVGGRSVFFSHLIQQLENFSHNGSGLEVEIEISDCSSNIFSKILEFIYTGTTQFLEQDILLLYDSAQTYRLQDLQSACETFIQTIINKDNVFDILKICNKIPNSEFIVQLCKNFLKERVQPTHASPPTSGFYTDRGALGFSSPLLNLSSPNYCSTSSLHTSMGLTSRDPVKEKVFVPPLLQMQHLSEQNLSSLKEDEKASVYTTSERMQWSMRSLQSLLSLVKTLVMADRITLFFYNQETEQLCSVVRSHSSEANNNVVDEYEIRIPCDLGIAGAVFVSGERVNSRDAYSDPRFFSNIDIQTGYRTRTMLCMPVIMKGRNQISGVIQVLNKLRKNLWGFQAPIDNNQLSLPANEAYFTEDDEKLLGLVCDLVAAVHERIIPESIQSRSINSQSINNQKVIPAGREKPGKSSYIGEQTQPYSKKNPPQTCRNDVNNNSNNNSNKRITWQHYKKRRRDSIPIFHFKLPKD